VESSLRQYIELYSDNKALIDAGSCEPMNRMRPLALQRLEQHGLPSRKVEEYKYTDIEQVLAPDYGVNLRRLAIGADPYQAYKCSVPGLGTSLYYMMGDCLCPARKDQPVLPDGVYVGSMTDFAARYPEQLAEHYGRLAQTEQDSLTALNTLLAQDGVVIRVAPGVKLDNAIQVVNLGKSDIDLMTNRRVMVIIGDGAIATLLFCDHNLDRSRYLTTQVGEVFVGKGASLSLCEIEETHSGNTLIDNTYIAQQAGSRIDVGYFTLHGGVTRRMLRQAFEGEGAEAKVYGGVIGDGTQHTDTNLLIDHRRGKCKSDVLYKYVLDGQSVGAFAGKVLVRKDAQRTDSQETNANLCVSPQARMYTQPMLEIYADDVKCNHGSTVGRLDNQALLYMAQRGIPEDEANLLLQQAFLDEAIRHITLEPLRERLTQMAERRFRYKLKSCEGCDLCAQKR